MMGNPQIAAMMNNPQAAALMNNPEVMRQTVEMMSANPQLLQAALQSNPAYQNAPPHMQQLMARPEFLRMAMEMSFGGGAPMAPPQQGNEEQYMQTLAALMSGGGAAPVEGNTGEPPEIRFQSQLQQLNEMGFYDPDSNIRALLACGGNVNLAIERLLSGNNL
jgi:ubiquilin